MKEMLKVYDNYKKDFAGCDGNDKGFIKARYMQLIGMLMMMKDCKVITANEYHIEMLDLQELKTEKGCV